MLQKILQFFSQWYKIFQFKETMFQLSSKYKPTWDQPKAILNIVDFLKAGYKYQTLWGVTGSGKTYTMANIIQEIKKPTLIIAHNKTLAAQLAQEFKEFFPDAAVHYFVSYYDYYQPEAYVQKTDTYIEKEATINEEIDRLRHAATQSLISRKDVIIVASVSCIYGIGDIDAYIDATFDMKVGESYKTEEILKNLVSLQYRRAWADFKPGTFQIMWDLLEIFPASEELVYSIEFWGDEVSQITRRNYLTGEIFEYLQEIQIFPAKHTVTTKDTIERIVPQIKLDLEERLKFFKDVWDVLRFERLKAKVEYDIEMMSEVGYVNGIENYSRYLDGRNQWEPPETLIDYFPDDFLCFIDESHMTIPQIWGMYNGDRARKTSLVENGFRLPAAYDNRPLRYEEFEAKMNQIVCVSATPASYEIGKSCEDEMKGRTKINVWEFSHSWENEKTNHLEIIWEWENLTDNEESYEGAIVEYIPISKRSASKKWQKWIDRFKNFAPMEWEKWWVNEENRIVDLTIRPTGLLDPMIEIARMEFMVDDIMKQVQYITEKNARMLITTITKRSSEELTDYLLNHGVKTRYLHSEIETLERLEILRDLRMWKIDVIVWVNLLREWLDLPEVSRICILDADKQWFLRSEPSLIQIIWRAARNSEGKVTMYVEKLKQAKVEEVKSQEYTPKKQKKSAEWEQLKQSVIEIWDFEKRDIYRVDNARWVMDNGLVISESMRKAINLTYYRRELQNTYNEKNGITPTTIFSSIKDMGIKIKIKKDYALAGDGVSAEKMIKKLELEMDIAAANLDFEQAAELRDAIIELRRGKKK